LSRVTRGFPAPKLHVACRYHPHDFPAMPHRRIAGVLLLISVAIAPVRGDAAERLSTSAAMDLITVDETRMHVSALADDTFEGREAGSRGGRAAAIYVVKELQKAGAPPGNRTKSGSADKDSVTKSA